MNSRIHSFIAPMTALVVLAGLVLLPACRNNGDSNQASAFMAGLASGAGTPIGPVPPAPDASGSAPISAAQGGMVKLGDNEVNLYVPPGSLSKDATIAIEPLATTPNGPADGHAKFGQAYRFTPAGTNFALEKPAILTMKFDAQALAAQGLSAESLQIYYYDEALSRYVNVPAQVDTANGTLVAHLEHFTIYLPMAKAMIPGNNAPTAALQTPIPNNVRADAPIYFRATARDYDLGGAVAGTRICYRKLQPVPGAYTCESMTEEKRENAINTYGRLVPASWFTAADRGPGPDIEYYVEVTDNLGAVSVSGTQTRDVLRVYQAGTINIAPGNQNMTAGSRRIFTTRGQDDLGANFTFIPETAVVGAGAGVVIRKEANGITFEARTTVVGSLTAGIQAGAETALSTVTVFNGEIAQLVILDQNSQPISGTLVTTEGQLREFDVVGYDAWNNQVLVNPVWTSDPGLGTAIDQNGRLHTVGGTGFGTITATLGSLTATQWLQVQDRNFNQIGGGPLPYSSVNHGPAITFVGGNPHVVLGNGNPSNVHVSIWTGASWFTLGGSLNQNTSQNAGMPTIANISGEPWVAFRQFTPGAANQLFVKRWDGANFSPVGPGVHLNVVANGDTQDFSLRTDGTTPHISFTQGTSTTTRLYVKRYDGTNWVLVGGPLNFNLAQSAIRSKIDFYAGQPMVAWQEWSGTNYQVRAKHWDGSNWNFLGGVLNVNPANGVEELSLKVINGVPHVAWSEDAPGGQKVVVKSWDGAAWNQLGGTIGGPITKAPTLKSFNGVPYVAVQHLVLPSTYTIAMYHWNGTTWVQDGANYNAQGGITRRPALAFDGATPWIIHEENSQLRAFTFE